MPESEQLAILFADILLIPDALGADLWFVTGEGPRLSTVTSDSDFGKLKHAADIHGHLAPVYETLRILRRELPPETALIGFAGPRVIATTIKQELPPGFQRAEFMLEKGMIDAIVRRTELRETLAKLIDYRQ